MEQPVRFVRTLSDAAADAVTDAATAAAGATARALNASRKALAPFAGSSKESAAPRARWRDASGASGATATTTRAATPDEEAAEADARRQRRQVRTTTNRDATPRAAPKHVDADAASAVAQFALATVAALGAARAARTYRRRILESMLHDVMASLEALALEDASSAALLEFWPDFGTLRALLREARLPLCATGGGSGGAHAGDDDAARISVVVCQADGGNGRVTASALLARLQAQLEPKGYKARSDAAQRSFAHLVSAKRR
jgi:hypothetical protein